MHNTKIQVAALPLALLVALAGCGGSSGGGDGGGEPLGLVTEDNASAVAVAAFRNMLVVPLIPQQYDQLADIVVLDAIDDSTGTFDCDTSGQISRTLLDSPRFDERLSADACRFDFDEFEITASFTLERGLDRDWPEFAVAFPPIPPLTAEAVQDHYSMRSGVLQQIEISTDDRYDLNLSGSVTRRLGIISGGGYPNEDDDYHFRWEYDGRDVRLMAPSEELVIDLGSETRLVADWFFDIEDNGALSLVTREARLAMEGRVRQGEEGLFEVKARDLQYQRGPQFPPSGSGLRNVPPFLGLGDLFGLPCPSLGVIDVEGADNTGLRVVFTQGAANAVFVQAFTAEGTRTLQYEFCSDFLAMNPVD